MMFFWYICFTSQSGIIKQCSFEWGKVCTSQNDKKQENIQEIMIVVHMIITDLTDRHKIKRRNLMQYNNFHLCTIQIL